MRRLSIGMSLAATAAAGLLSVALMQQPVALRPNPPKVSNEQRRRRGKNKKGPPPNGLTAQKNEKARLICDRGSSFKKLRRWARRYPDQVKQPDLKAKRRHAWFRNLEAQAQRAV